MNNNDHLHTEPAQPSLSSAAHTTPAAPPRPRSSFADFDADQLAQIAAWLDQHTYDQVIPLIHEKFGRTISRTALFRFHSSIAPAKFLVDSPQTAEAAAQILAFAATGQPNFTQAGLHILEQTAFQLAATCRQQPADLKLLDRLTHIICRQRNTVVRERHAAVQERKCDLRAQELELKNQIARHRLSTPHSDARHLAFPQPGNPPLVPPTMPNAQSPMLNAQNLQSTISNFQSLPLPLRRPGPHPLPPEVIENNIRYGAKLRAEKLRKAQAQAQMPNQPPPMTLPADPLSVPQFLGCHDREIAHSHPQSPKSSIYNLQSTILKPNPISVLPNAHIDVTPLTS